MKALINYLHLVYPPVSNQEAQWLKDDQDVRRIVSRSKLYMIAQRQEILFSNLVPEASTDKLQRGNNLLLELTCGSVKLPEVLLSLDQFGGEDATLDFDLGPKLIKIYDARDHRLLDWFTPDKLLFDYWRGRVKVTGLSRFRELTKFRLFYVGISKEDDSFVRLFEQGHKARLEILTNEQQITPTARLTDELYLFFFDLEDANIRTYTEGSDFSTFGQPGPEKLKCIADAEKAIAQMLQPTYNKVTFKGYPDGTDGLYREELDLYGYMINEELVFETGTQTIEGVYLLRGGAHRHPDAIWIQQEIVELVKSGTASLPTSTFEGDVAKKANEQEPKSVPEASQPPATPKS